MFDWIADPQAWMALATLTALEIVLGIDNIIFLAILVQRLPRARQRSARLIGLSLALILRLVLLASLAWIVKLTADLFTVLGQGISGRDLVLILGGLFLLVKATMEIGHEMEETDPAHVLDAPAPPGRASYPLMLVQIALLDLVFSLDSVITAVGMADHLPVMIIAVVIAILFMMAFAGSVGEFITRHPSLKMLALAFLVLIGTALIADGLEFHIPKGYIYFAMAFSFAVELLNQRVRARRAAAGRRVTEVIAALPAAFVLLLVVIDPFGLTPMFSALTRGREPAERRRTAIKAVLIAAAVLALFIFTGSRLFDYLGIGMPAFRIAGGVLLFLVAMDMLLVRHSGLTAPTAQERSEAARRDEVAVFPLAIPLIAGPGALTTVMLLTRDQPLPLVLAVLGLTLAVLAITLVLFLTAPRVERLLGETGINVITRLLGILLAALAVQFALDGLRESLPGLAGGFAAAPASR